ncbi:MAG: hypothetical protein ACK41E_01280 [Deinococcales bacterium]
MKKLFIAVTLFISSLALAQMDFTSLAEAIQKYASEDFLFTGIEVSTLKKLMGDPKKTDTMTYTLKDAQGFESVYRVQKSVRFVQIFESKISYWVTFAAFPTQDDVLIAMVTSAQKDSAGRGNDLEFFSLRKKQAQPSEQRQKWYSDVIAFANGKCKVPKGDVHFELKENAKTIRISGFDIDLTGKKYTLAGELVHDGNGGWSFDPKTAKC